MAKKNAPPSGDKSDNNELLLGVGLVAIIFILWFAYHTRVAQVVLGIRGLEALIISLFTSELDPLRAWMKVIDRKAVTAGDLWQVSSTVGSYVRWISFPILLATGFWLMRHSPTERFRRKFTDVTLPKVEADLYPWMKISTKLDFSSMDVEKGNWAMAKTERQFVRLHKLRKENGELDAEKSETVFISQIGPVFLGYKNLKPHAKALFALFATRANKDFRAGDALLIQLAMSAADGKIDYTNVDQLAQKYGETKKVKKLIAQHAYERTLLMSMLEEARGGPRGKDYLPPNWFLWLKGVDRALWYALSDTGRETPHPESAGVFGHWLAEKARGKRLEMPFVKNAVEGLAKELAKFTNDDSEEEGISETDDLIEVKQLPPAPRIPSPEEAEQMRKLKAAGKSASGAGGKDG